MSTVHIISHTHWDREWYQPFQLFRLKLVHLVDNLLTILDNDPKYEHFMLDGQTIVLEDYLQMRMDCLPELSNFIQQNRILIGPWYILPDEFLVSPEATIRNLMIGKKICEYFGHRMMIGYIPDPFGHISQLPQILKGFHMDSACLWRGVPNDKDTLVWWDAPDGSRVLLMHLYSSYGNGAYLPAADVEDTADQLKQAVDTLAPHNPVSHTLIMRGSDHLEPHSELPEQLAVLNQMWEGEIKVKHSTLPNYLESSAEEIQQKGIQLDCIQGELRDPHKANTLPAVLSARMWIKQRNHAAETMLERWVEPFTTWAELTLRFDHAFTKPDKVQVTPRIADPSPLVHQAWKLLITNHPHDSICGCSIDQVHDEMRPRFDQVDQITEELTNQSLSSLAESIDSTPLQSLEGAYTTLTVFNAAPYPQAGVVHVDLDLPTNNRPIQIVDETGKPLVHSLYQPERKFIEQDSYPMNEFKGILYSVVQSGYKNQQMVSAHLTKIEGKALIEAEFSNVIEPDLQNLMDTLTQIQELIATSKPNDRVKVKLFNTWSAKADICVPEIPAFGFRSFWIIPQASSELPTESLLSSDKSIENEYYRIFLEETDGTLTVIDKLTQKTYPGLNLFVDVADAGDEYNFCPLKDDLAHHPTLTEFNVHSSPSQASISLSYDFHLPLSLDPDRKSRSAQQTNNPLTTTITLLRGVQRIDFRTTFENKSQDHRLSVKFPTGLKVESARMDGHFDIVERRLDLPKTDETWVELPRPEVPQRSFTDVSVENQGLMLANRGLPEVAVLKQTDGSAEINLTLLRCVGWLSRDDMWVRKGHAGPGLPTPGAQELGIHTFEYALIPHDGDWLKTSQQAYNYQTELRAMVTQPHSGTLPACTQIIKVDPAEFMVTAIRTAESEQGWIVRGVNLSDKPIKVALKPFRMFPSANLVYLDESPNEALKPSGDGSVSFELGAKAIATVLFSLSG